MRIPIAAVLVAICIAPARAPAQVFHDDFDSVDPTVWSIQPGDGQVVSAGGAMILSCSGSTFPAVVTKYDPFPSGDFVVRVGMRYRSVARCGNGVGAVDNFYPFYPQGCRPFLAWQDNGGWYVYSGGTGYSYLGTGPETNSHIYEWRYQNGGYEFLLDGVSIRQESCAPRATALFFGHLHPVACSPWTSFEVDFVDIRPFEPVDAAKTTWGKVKSLYR